MRNRQWRFWIEWEPLYNGPIPWDHYNLTEILTEGKYPERIPEIDALIKEEG